MALQEGQNVGAYRILAQLGQGGMATVYKAYHAKLDRFVAIKVVHQAFLEDPAFLSRFEREAQIVARLDHPHIVPVYDYAEHNKQPYLVMKYIEGRTLKALLNSGAPTLERTIEIMTSIASALDYAHAQDVLHRDIKPSNIVIDVNGVPYLTDFGLARIAQMGESTLSQDVLIGTPHYISPEQAMGKRELTPRTDIYSLGVVLYEMVVGRVPFSADTPYAIIHDHIYRALPLPTAVNPDLPGEIETVLLKALAKDPNDRYGSAGEMMAAFKNAVQRSGLKQLKPNRISEAAVSIARMRDEDELTVTPPRIPSPRQGDESPKAKRAEPPPIPAIPGIPQPPRPPAPPWNQGNNKKVEFQLDLGEVGSQIRKNVENWEESSWNPENWPEEDVPLDDEASIRKRIEKQHKKRVEFVTHFSIYVVINLMLLILFLAGSNFIVDVANLGSQPEGRFINEFPWPLIILFGWGSGLLAHGIETFFETGSRAAKRERAVREEMVYNYGNDWRTTVSKIDYNKVRRRIMKPFKKRVEFFQHAVVYVMINIMLLVVFLAGSNIIVDVANLEGAEAQALGFPWPLIVMLGWGAGLVGHAAETFLSGRRNEDAIRKAIEREREMLDVSSAMEKPKRERSEESPVRLTDEGELTDSMAAELNDWDVEKPKRSRR